LQAVKAKGMQIAGVLDLNASGRGTLDVDNRPVLDFAKVVAGQERGGPFVSDDRSFANVIIGNYQAPQPGSKGHYHEEGSEFWLIMLGKIRTALGSLDRVKRVVKVLGMVNSADGFSDQPKVVNGFSDLMVEVFGEAIGKHARSAVGMAGLPGNAPIEVEMIVEVE